MEVKHRIASSTAESTLSSDEKVETHEVENTSSLVVVAFSDSCLEETKQWLQDMFSSPGTVCKRKFKS